MSVIRKINRFISNPRLLGSYLVAKYANYIRNDKLYLELKYYFVMGKRLNLSNPKGYNEKLQWLKLYYRNPDYTKLVDKYSVKEHVSSIIGNGYIIPTIGAWDTPAEIEWDKLPEQFVLKTTHGGGNEGVIICKNKSSIDKHSVICMLNKAMDLDLFVSSREWPYKNIRRRIIAEPFLEDSETGELRDYKFFCFNGKVKALFVATERQTRKEPFFNFFDENYNSLDIKQGHPRSENTPEKPSKFEQMKALAEKLSSGFPHVRVDLYQANNRVYFGEFTFYHFGGLVPFEPKEWDLKFGSWLDLSQIKDA